MCSHLQAGAEVHTVPRGGEVTYHGPGQCVIYPVMNIRTMGPRAYVEALQAAMITTLEDWGICAHADRPKTAGVRSLSCLKTISLVVTLWQAVTSACVPALHVVCLQVWVGDRKIGAIGVRFSRGVSTHGMALNVDMDLDWFDKIVPCGDPSANVTSMADQLGCSVDVQKIHSQMAMQLIKELRVQHVQSVTPETVLEECGITVQE